MPPAGKTRTDATGAFFGDVSTRGRIDVLGSTAGTIRFDVSDPTGVERWYVTIARGEVTVSHRNARADAVCGSNVVYSTRSPRDGGMPWPPSSEAPSWPGAISDW